VFAFTLLPLLLLLFDCCSVGVVVVHVTVLLLHCCARWLNVVVRSVLLTQLVPLLLGYCPLPVDVRWALLNGLFYLVDYVVVSITLLTFALCYDLRTFIAVPLTVDLLLRCPVVYIVPCCYLLDVVVIAVATLLTLLLLLPCGTRYCCCC